MATITNCYMSPSICANGEMVRVHYTILNDASSKIVSYTNRLYVMHSTYVSPITASVTTKFTTPILKGETREFSVDYVIDLSLLSSNSAAVSTQTYFEQNAGLRSLEVFANPAAYSYRQIIGTLLNTRYAPSISTFNIERSDEHGVLNDEGETLLTTLKLVMSKHVSFPTKIYYTQSPDVPKNLRSETYPIYPMSSDTWAECEASASSVYSGNDYDDFNPYHAFDITPISTAWRSSTNASAPWIQLKMPKSLYDIKVTLDNIGESPAHGMTSGVVYGVDDDGKLTQIGSFSGRDGATNMAESTIVCTNTDRAFHTVRVKATSWNGSTFVAVGNMKVTGNTTPASEMPVNMQVVDITGITDGLNAEITSTDIIPGLFSNGVGWNFLLVFGDEYEQVTASVGITRAFANLHLSGYPTGGACFGGFCSSTPDNPKLESHYPGYFYNGIKKIGNGWQELTPVNGKTPAIYGGGVLRCRKIEDKCIIAGSVEVKPSSSTLVLADLPEGFVPAYNVFSLNACSGGRVARIAVYSNEEANAADTRGKLVLTWVKDISDGDNYTSAAIWIQCSIEYWVEPPVEDVLLCGEAVCNTTTVVGKVL